ncbi:hypothetical protein BJN34_35535 (plasmid) [Cupriavidus necator]|uniref:Uncharacterized protein n=1 Tax=Cupriavidus necator TaxID=106590 RepID=A0A1U9V3U8_CUPNE|nr:hypothetical protein [Cupriavidus necator]AQV99191.1 hypothetical protein BJN34_35535 [Cupriavidus necator]
MIHTRSGADALAKRDVVVSPGTGNRHWGTVFFGPRSSAERQPGPQATMSELDANETIVPHFHGVTMFQLFVAGSGTIGNRGQVLQPLTVQFKDHHTAYGPIVAGPQGLSFVAMRMYTGNSEPIYLDKPGYRERLEQSKRRHLTSEPVRFSTEPVLKSRKEVTWETLFADESDGMAAQVVRLGEGMSVQGPDPRAAGGYYLFVGNGSLIHGDEELPQWSMVVVEPTEEKFEIRAGANGLEAMVLQYPREERAGW